MALEMQPSGRFGTLLHSAIDEKGLSLRDVAEQVTNRGKTNLTYEHMRKLIRGFAWPSPMMLDELQRVIGFKQKDAEAAIAQDKIKRKFGKLPAEMSNKNPELDAIEREWAYLQTWQKEALNQMAKNFGREARAAKAAK